MLSSMKNACNLRPLFTFTLYKFNQRIILSIIPFASFNCWIDIVVPSFATVFSRPKVKLMRLFKKPSCHLIPMNSFFPLLVLSYFGRFLFLHTLILRMQSVTFLSIFDFYLFRSLYFIDNL